MPWRAFLFFASILTFGCKSPSDTPPTRTDKVKAVAEQYFATFADRSDWEKLLSFYREDMRLEDVLLQIQLDSLWQFERFYKWDDEGENFKKLTPDQDHLTIRSLIANDSVAVGYGRVNPFYYYDRLVDVEWGMQATFFLYFDEDLKIKKQVDWIEYDPDVMQSVIDRFRKQGVDVPPDWLDLSKSMFPDLLILNN